MKIIASLLLVVLLVYVAIDMLLPQFLGFVNDDESVEAVSMKSCSQKGDI